MKLKTTAAAVSVVLTLSIAGYAVADGNRYDRDRQYNSEISSAEAYLAMMQNNAVILDVRRLREYAAGHPERAYNVPYPNIVNSGDQSAEDFYWEVYDLVNGKTDTPLVTVCRTGSRSIAAANILADPLNEANDPGRDAVPGGIPFTNVRNHWDGFVGLYRYAFVGGVPDPNIPLDLDNDGEINVDFADLFPDTNPDTKDANPDKDGWRNFQGLPWTPQIRKPLAYLQDPSLYDQYQYDYMPSWKKKGKNK
jgi:rhodanese-related sulfurtransferase